MADARSMVWVSADGLTRMTVAKGNASLATVQTNLAALSNAVVQEEWEGVTTVSGSAPVAATYLSVLDSASLIYQDAGGNLVKLVLVAPVSSVFLADQETVDPTAIAVLTASVIGTVLTPGGGVVSAFVGGVRARRG